MLAFVFAFNEINKFSYRNWLLATITNQSRIWIGRTLKYKAKGSSHKNNNQKKRRRDRETACYNVDHDRVRFMIFVRFVVCTLSEMKWQQILSVHPPNDYSIIVAMCATVCTVCMFGKGPKINARNSNEATIWWTSARHNQKRNLCKFIDIAIE